MPWIQKKYRYTEYGLRNYGSSSQIKRGTAQVYKGQETINDKSYVYIQRTPTSKSMTWYVGIPETSLVEVSNKPTIIIKL